MLLTAFDSVAFAVDCVVSKNVLQLLIWDIAICVFNWCELTLNI